LQADRIYAKQHAILGLSAFHAKVVANPFSFHCLIGLKEGHDVFDFSFHFFAIRHSEQLIADFQKNRVKPRQLFFMFFGQEHFGPLFLSSPQRFALSEHRDRPLVNQQLRTRSGFAGVGAFVVLGMIGLIVGHGSFDGKSVQG